MSTRTAAWKVLAVIAIAGAAPLAHAQAYTVPGAVAGVTGGESFSSSLSFRPFGWSADGKFAWLESEDVDGRGGTVYTYTIYDAVEDSVVYTHSDDSFDWGTDVDATEAESWRRSGTEVSAALAQAAIVQSPRIEVAAFPLTRAGDRYTATLTTRDTPGSGEGDDDRISSYTLTLSSRARGSKVVTAQDKLAITSAVVDGCILSPMEPRILVVVSQRSRAFEGSAETLRFFGAHLGVGFRK